jgi:hypothetical protein
VARKIGSAKKCAISSSKVRAALNKQTAGRSAKLYRELGLKIKVHHNTVKKYLTKMRVHRKAKKFTPKTTSTIRHQNQVEPRALFSKIMACHFLYK